MNIVQAATKHPQLVIAYGFEDINNFLLSVPSFPKAEMAQAEAFASAAIVKLKEAPQGEEFISAAGGDVWFTVENESFVTYAVADSDTDTPDGEHLINTERTVIDEAELFFALFFEFQDASAPFKSREEFLKLHKVHKVN